MHGAELLNCLIGFAWTLAFLSLDLACAAGRKR
jgi:hypothetical protein